MASAIRAGCLGRSDAIALDLSLGSEIDRGDLRAIGDDAVGGSVDQSIARGPELVGPAPDELRPCLDRAGRGREAT